MLSCSGGASQYLCCLIFSRASGVLQAAIARRAFSPRDKNQSSARARSWPRRRTMRRPVPPAGSPLGSSRRGLLRPPGEPAHASRALAGALLFSAFGSNDLGYFDLETRVLEPLDNPFGPRLLPMWPNLHWTVDLAAPNL